MDAKLGRTRDRPTRAFAAAVATLVVTADRPAHRVQPPGDGVVTIDVLTQTMHDQDPPARAVGGPVTKVQQKAVGRDIEG